jgi:ketosteroid isomerase-like protein
VPAGSRERQAHPPPSPAGTTPRSPATARGSRPRMARYFAAVSELDVDVVRRMFTAFAERDLDAMLPTMHEDVEFLPVTANLTTGGMPYHGHEGIARYLKDVEEVWPQLRIYPDDIRDRGDSIVVIGRVRARGGGMIIDRPTGWVFNMRDGQIVRGRVYGTPGEALEANARD